MTGDHGADDGSARPWWASRPGDEVGSDADPLTRHRQARAGDADPTGTPPGTPRWWGPAAEAMAQLSEDLAASATANADAARGHRPWQDDATDRERAHLDVCGVCPICVGLRALETHRPELVGHLAEAARHLAAAVRHVVDTDAEPASRRRSAGSDDGLTRIDLDDLDDLDDDRDDRRG